MLVEVLRLLADGSQVLEQREIPDPETEETETQAEG